MYFLVNRRIKFIKFSCLGLVAVIGTGTEYTSSEDYRVSLVPMVLC